MTNTTVMTKKQSLYDMLGVRLQATQRDIDAAYAALKEKHEALRAKGDAADSNQLLFLKEAYLILSDSVKRDEYDNKLAAALFSTSEQRQASKFEAVVDMLATNPKMVHVVGIFLVILFSVFFVNRRDEAKPVAEKQVAVTTAESVPDGLPDKKGNIRAGGVWIDSGDSGLVLERCAVSGRLAKCIVHAKENDPDSKYRYTSVDVQKLSGRASRRDGDRSIDLPHALVSGPNTIWINSSAEITIIMPHGTDHLWLRGDYR